MLTIIDPRWWVYGLFEPTYLPSFLSLSLSLSCFKIFIIKCCLEKKKNVVWSYSCKSFSSPGKEIKSKTCLVPPHLLLGVLFRICFQWFTISHFIYIQPTLSPAHYTEMALASHQINMTLVLRMERKEGSSPLAS